MRCPRKSRKLYKIMIVSLGFLLVACQSKSDVFKTENIRFFPASFYYVGDPSKLMSSNEEDKVKKGTRDKWDNQVCFKIQFVANTQEDAEDFKDQIDSAQIIGEAQTLDAEAFVSDITEITTASGKIKNELDGNYMGELTIWFLTEKKLTADSVKLYLKDGTIKNLDCDIHVEPEVFLEDLNVNQYTHKSFVWESTVEGGYQGGLSLSVMGKLKDQFSMDLLHYDTQKMNATFDEASQKLHLEGKQEYRTFTYVCYVKWSKQIYPFNGYVAFQPYNDDLKWLS